MNHDTLSKRHRRSLLCSLLAGIFLCQPRPAEAADYLAAEPLESKKIRIDGMLRDWPGDFPKLRHSLKGKSQGGEALVGYDDQYLYFALDVKDDRIARTRAAGQNEDHLRLEVFVPKASGGGGSTTRIDVFPGQPGKLPAVVKVDGKTIGEATAVEAEASGRLTLEARLPWSAVPKAAARRVGLRGRLVYYDAAQTGQVRAIAATSSAQGASMPPLTFGAETGLFQSLIEPKGLPDTPARSAFGDLTGTGGVEHVAIYGHFLSIVGPGYKNGQQFYVSELDVASADRVRRLELRDLSGDGRDEIILEKRIGPEKSYREVLQVLTLGKDGAPRQVFAAEVGMVTPRGSLRNEVLFTGRGAQARIVISQGKSKDFEPASFEEPVIGGGITPALLPWESVVRRTYGWQDSGLALLEEKTDGTATKVARRPATEPQRAPPPPRAPSADEMQDRVYGLYKTDRGVARSSKPRFDLVTDLVGDTQMERIVIHDRDLVVFGKGFKQGLSYTFLTIGVKDSSDILSVTTRDLVGDGKAEIIVHAVQKTQASKQLGGDVVLRQALFVYKVIGETLTRVFAAETGRALERNRIVGSVTFAPRGTGTAITLDRLRAIGWTEKNYPYPEDTQPSGGLEPLLLPWGSAPARTYVFDGSRYVLDS